MSTKFQERFGDMLRKKRESKHWSRNYYMERLYENLPQFTLDEDLHKNLYSHDHGEAWLGTVERGDAKKLDRILIELLIAPFKLSERERARFLFAAGFHPFFMTNSAKEPTDADYIIVETMLLIHESACDLLSRLLAQEPALQTNPKAKLRAIKDVITLVLNKLDGNDNHNPPK